MTTWFTSDAHIGHRKVAELRGFESPAEHDEAFADGWCDRVRRGDTVWVLGDLAASSPAGAFDILNRLPGEKHLIWGNHDGGHPMHRDAHRQQRKYLATFASTALAARRRIDGTEVLLSHMPYRHDRDAEPRYPQWRLADQGLWLLHGHTHSPQKHLPEEPRQIHVGVDAWGMRPASLEEIGALMVELDETAAAA